MSKKISFIKLPVKKGIFNIYIGCENKKSIVQQSFNSLANDIKKSIKTLIIRMAQNENYRSDSIKYNLKKYNYGEIRPMPHRFFFFQKCGNNYIFFDYIEKKTYQLSDRIYKEINIRKIRYEQEFERQFLQGIL